MVEEPKKRSFLVGIVQIGALLFVIATIFFTVPAMNKMAQRKPDTSNNKNTASSSKPTNAGTTGSQNSAGINNPNGSTSTKSAESSSRSSNPTTTNLAPVQQATAGEYNITVNKVETNFETGVIAVTLDIGNPSKVSLKFDPARQFTFIGSKTGTSRSPIIVDGQPTFSATTLKPNQTLSSILYVQKYATEDGELRFYPQAGEKEFTVIPLIPVPAGQ